jgi:glycosyltransferase involved in cell wall biosynthesis
LRPDLVHSHQLYADREALPVAARLAVPAVRSVHGVTQFATHGGDSPPRAREDWLEGEKAELRSLSRHCLQTIAPCAALAGRLRRLGVSDVVTLYPGTPPVDGRGDVDPASVQPLTLGFIGRLEPVKNPLAAVQLAHACAREGIEVRVLIVGGGRLRTATRRLIRTLRVESRVTMAPFTTDVGAVLRTLHCLFLPSHSEGLPHALIEAMTRGKCVLASNVGGMSEVIAHGRNGFLLPPERLQASAVEHVGELAAKPDLRRRIGRAAATSAGRRFRMDRHVAGLFEIYSRSLR